MNMFLSRMSDSYRGWRAKRLVSRLSPLIPQMVAASSYLTEIAPANSWKIQRVNHSLSDMDVIWISPQSDSYTVILRIPGSCLAVQGFERQKSICATLQKDSRLGEWRRLLPRFLYEGQLHGQSYSIEKQLPGTNATLVMLDVNKRQIALNSALEAVTYLHQKTSKNVIFDAQLLESWVLNPIQIIRNSILVCYHRQAHAYLDKLEQQLSEALLGKPILTSWIHGDYWPENILVTEDGTQVTGIVDWDLSQPMGLPSLDLVNLLISTRRIAADQELGGILVEILGRGSWHENEQALWDKAKRMLPGNVPDLRDLLLLFWLQHVSANLSKTWRYTVNPIWVNANFIQILNYL